MKNVSKLLSLALVVSALVFTGCTKKPVRNAQSGQMGNNGIDPTAVAVASDVAPGTDLLARGDTSLDGTLRNAVESVYFDFDRSAVSSKERPKIEAAVKYLKDNADKRMLMEGHCDWRGTAEYNLGLGDRRANAVKRYLESLGVDPARLEILSKGSLDAKQGGSEADWGKDRRVDFVVLTK
jgi:peptidoglycan-associated lipoprotein